MITTITLALLAAAIAAKSVWALSGARKTMRDVERWQNKSDSPHSLTQPEELKAA